MRSPTYTSPEIESGLILLDSSCSVVTLDGGAAAILANCRHRRREPPSIDERIKEAVRRLSDPACSEHQVRIDLNDVICRTYLLESRDPSIAKPLIAVLLQRHQKSRDLLDDIAARYHLTQREQQALRGLSTGLSTKALAATMNIKPSTLRSFLRLIKIKMGAPTRSELMAKLLQRQ